MYLTTSFEKTLQGYKFQVSMIQVVSINNQHYQLLQAIGEIITQDPLSSTAMPLGLYLLVQPHKLSTLS